MTERTARALFRACAIPGAGEPYDRAALKIYYPALPDDGEEQRNAGVVPADTSGAPYPVVLIMPGINIGPESYAWLAQFLAFQGMIVVTYTMIAEEMPGYISLTPGLDLGAITPDTYGKQPSGTAIAPILEALEQENQSGVLEGRIDTGSVILAGHSGGGSVALFNANPAWFPAVKGAFAFGAHSGASTILGFAENTTLELPGAVPLMVISGTRDGVIANSAHRYGEAEAPNRVAETFDKGFTSNRGDSYLVEIDGANHFSIAWPPDESTGRHFLDEPEEGNGEVIRALLAELAVAFIHDTLAGETRRVPQLADHVLVSAFRCR